MPVRGNLRASPHYTRVVVGSVLFVVLAMVPTEGLVPPAPGAAPAPAPSGVVPPVLEENSGAVTELPPVTAVPAATQTPPTTPDRVREAAQAREAARGKAAPPAPEPPAGSSQPPYEIGGFLDRPAPEAPRAATTEEDASSADATGNLVWGIHRPVAKWKRDGLIGSGVLTGVAIGTAIGSRIVGQRRLDDVEEYLQDQGRYGQSGYGACQQNTDGAGGGVSVVDDVGLAHKCQRFDRMRVTRGVAVGLSVVGIASTVTFGILHLVHREEEPRRVEARNDGFAVRF